MPPKTTPRVGSLESRNSLAFRAGDYLRFKFQTKSFLDVYVSEEIAQLPEQPSSDIDLQLKGIFHLRVYEENDSHFTLGFELSKLKGAMHSSRMGQMMNSEEIVAGMSGEVLAKMHRLGRIETLSFPESTTAMGRNYWRALLALWQFVLAEDESSERWETTEEDPTGEYIAVYTKKRHESRIELTKEKQAYKSVLAKGEDVADFADSTAVSGKALIVLDPLPLSVEGEEWMQLSPQGIPQTFVSGVTYSFKRLEHVHQQDLATVVNLDQAGYLKASRISAAEPVNTELPVVEAMSEHEIADYLAEVRGVVAKIGLHSDQLATQLARLAELMKQDPRVVAAVMARLREGDVSDDATALFLSALGTAGTREAQEGLREIFTGEEWAQDRRESAMLAFVDVEYPEAAVDDDLVDLYEQKGELSSTALLLLAAVGNQVEEGDPQRYEEIDAYVQDQLLDDRLTREERTTALEALGNLQPAATSPLVEEALLNEDEDIRSAAVHALRGTFDETANHAVADAIRDDPSAMVRVAAVEVLLESERDGGNELLDEALHLDESEHVRKKILHGRGERSTPEARDAIAWAAENNGSEEVRRLAEEILRAQQENERRMAAPEVENDQDT